MIRFKQFLEEHSVAYQEGVSLANYTTFRIGGPCRMLVQPSDTEEIIAVTEFCRNQELPFIFLGNGSNVLVSDKGYPGVVILLNRNFSEISLIGENLIYAQSGASLMKVCLFAQQYGLTGMEFAYGIPATVGGAVYMNAGAYGGEIKDILDSAEYLDENGNKQVLTVQQAQLSYRHSFFTDHPKCCVTGAYYRLDKGNPDEIKAKMDDIYGRRKSKQPLEFPSAGSTFKRPANAFAAKLIEDCGLKGVSVGGAQVSEKHSGFVINRGNATCEDVLQLIELVKQTVKKQTGILLECEVKIIR